MCNRKRPGERHAFVRSARYLVLKMLNLLPSAVTLPWPLQSRLEQAVRALLDDGAKARIDFAKPPGEAALLSPDSVSWRVFKNPVALFIGGITAVIMELAEPRVRSGVWDHSSFRSNPVPRMKRTGLAALITVYGAYSVAEAMIANVRRMHGQISGTTTSGI